MSRQRIPLHRRHPGEYSTWLMMRQRCLNRRCADYPRYGGRGIRIARRWESFEAFLEDFGPRPRGYALVRKTFDSDFRPGARSWAPRGERQRRAARRLTARDAERIREKHRAGAARADLARLYGVSLQHVCYVVAGRRWPVRKEAARA